ncbi:hypothetical protein QBC44DRAFT_386480 [Cladorrhinum sp. PSN332]|nr:hypothetical protein QBC44DRAFT_386480 [Cladorrhinum sp. PSN332]
MKFSLPLIATFSSVLAAALPSEDASAILAPRQGSYNPCPDVKAFLGLITITGGTPSCCESVTALPVDQIIPALFPFTNAANDCRRLDDHGFQDLDEFVASCDPVHAQCCVFGVSPLQVNFCRNPQ